MSKEYGYFEAMEEIIKDESKVFIGGSEHNKKLFYNKPSCEVRIADKSDNFEYSHTPTINYFWKNTKWTLAEEKKNYNIRVYGINNSKLISSEIVEMTKTEMEIYCKSKVVWEVEYPTSKKNNLLELGTTAVKFMYLHCRKPITKVVCEEIITT